MSNDPLFLDNPDVTSDQSGAWNGGAFNNLVSSRTAAIVAAAAVTALSTASISQLANYSGTNYTGQGSCQSFNASSWGDPHITTMLGGQNVGNGGAIGDETNFSSVYNTQGGATVLNLALGTNTYEYQETWNKTATLYHYGANAYQLSITTADGLTGNSVIDDADGSTYIDTSDDTGQIIATITTSSGTQSVYNGETLPDGTVVNLNPNQQMTITQPLNQGGSLTTTVNLTYATDSEAFLDVDQSANGAALVNGDAFDLADGAADGWTAPDQALLLTPCSSSNQNVTPGTLPNGSNPSPSDTGFSSSDSSSPASSVPADTASTPAALAPDTTASPADTAPAAPPTPVPTPVPAPTAIPQAFDTNDNSAAQENS